MPCQFPGTADPARRRGYHPATSQWSYTRAEVEFARAAERLGRRRGRHLSAAEILALAKALGYAKAAPAAC